MSRTQNLRWKRKALVVAAVAVSFAGYAAIGSSTVSAGNYAEWDCSGTDPLTDSRQRHDDVHVTDDGDDTVPDDTIPGHRPGGHRAGRDRPARPTVTTQPPSGQHPAGPDGHSAVTPIGRARPWPPRLQSSAPVLPVTGRGSALPTAFIAIGLLGAGSVALAFARRNAAARSNES